MKHRGVLAFKAFYQIISGKPYFFSNTKKWYHSGQSIQNFNDLRQIMYDEMKDHISQYNILEDAKKIINQD